MLRKALFLLALLLPTLSVWAAKDPVYSGWRGAISGYDPVAYFTEKKPVKGSSRHRFNYQGAKWHFASAENLQLFQKNPEQYAPQYGGYCAWAVSQGYTASTDPEAWTLHDGKLYLNYSKSVQQQWNQERENNIRKANKNWPQVLN